MNAGLVENDRHGLAHMLAQQCQEGREEFGGEGASDFGAEQATAAEQRCHDVQRLPRGASMHCCWPRSVQALRLGGTCAKPASST